MWFVLLQFNGEPVFIGQEDWEQGRPEVELFGPFNTSEQAEQWVDDLHPAVKSRPGYHAIILTATPVGREC